MRKTPLRAKGKKWKATDAAYKVIKQQLVEDPIQYCEAALPGCLHTMYLQIAHKHRRNFYEKEPWLLADKSEWIVACTSCHEKMDKRNPQAEALTEELFDRLRG